jgi:competence protein ComFC
LSGLFNLNEFFKDTFLPPLCPVCGKISTEFLCKGCAENIKFLGFDICIRCGKPLAGPDSKIRFDNSVSDSKICTLCRSEKYYFYKSRSYTEYNDTISRIILKYKYRKYNYLVDLLVNFLDSAYESYYSGLEIDFLDTVPDCHAMDSWSTAKVENHMNIIAERFSRITGIPFADNMLKVRKTDRQQVLDRSQRKVNLKGAFKTGDCLKVQGKDFLIIDDVWTTGSTLNELSLTLKRSGAHKIYLLTIARKL